MDLLHIELFWLCTLLIQKACSYAPSLGPALHFRPAIKCCLDYFRMNFEMPWKGEEKLIIAIDVGTTNSQEFDSSSFSYICIFVPLRRMLTSFMKVHLYDDNQIITFFFVLLLPMPPPSYV
jgi:hypothetical protein